MNSNILYKAVPILVFDGQKNIYVVDVESLDETERSAFKRYLSGRPRPTHVSAEESFSGYAYWNDYVWFSELRRRRKKKISERD